LNANAALLLLLDAPEIGASQEISHEIMIIIIIIIIVAHLHFLQFAEPSERLLGLGHLTFL